MKCSLAGIFSLTLLLLLAAPSAGQNRTHPGLVHVYKTGWMTPSDAQEKGHINHHGRWFKASMKKKLNAWEKEDSRHKDWNSARKLKTKNYRITTNLPRFIFELEVRPFLDELYRTYVKIFKRDFGLSGKGANNHFLKIYYGYRSYGENEKEDGQPTPRTTPGFIVGDSLSVYYEDEDPGLFYSTVFHEGAHQFLAAILPGASLPTWLDEALATYFEGCTYSRATGKITQGFICPEILQAAQELLKEAKLQTGRGLAESLFLNVPYEMFDAEHYALSWSFVYYLIHRENGKYKKQFIRFLSAINGAGVKPVAEVYRETTRRKLTSDEAGWKEATLALQCPDVPHFAVIFRVAGEGPMVDLADHDLITHIGDEEIFSAARALELWEKRDQEAPLTFRLYRKIPVSDFTEFRYEHLSCTVPEKTELELSFAEGNSRGYGLED